MQKWEYLYVKSYEIKGMLQREINLAITDFNRDAPVFETANERMKWKNSVKEKARKLFPAKDFHINYLNELGAQGWELVSGSAESNVEDWVCFFKRRIQ